jgi:hypothetical protein
VIIGGLEPAVVEAERLAGAVLEVKLAVIAGAEVPRRKPLRVIGIEHPVAVEEAARVAGDHADWSAGPPSRMKRRSQ